MSEKIYNKLVRDKIPEIIEAHGLRVETRTLSNEDYRSALLDKLIEEAIELRDDGGSLSERVDVEEVMRAIDRAFGYETETIESARAEKADTRGSFDRRIYLEKTVE